MGAVFGIAFVIYMIACSIIVPTHLLGRAVERKECERTHNVHRCEEIREWLPAAPTEGEA